MKMLATILSMATLAAVSNAAAIMDTPLPFSIYPDKSWCRGEPLSSGIVLSVTPLKRLGNFCESSIQKTPDGQEITVYTKVRFASCEAVSLGFAFLDTYSCADSECTDCSDKTRPVQASLMLPKFSPLPEAETCWAISASTTGVTVFNQFDKGADPDGIDSYWKVFMENSCLQETVEITSAAPISSTSFLASATVGILSAASLLMN